MSMELDNSFTVPVPPETAWDVLLDVERIAPCMPGATVDEFDGDVVAGRIKVKVGPVSLTYRGTAKFTERDEGTHTILLEASGKETRGAGTASATVKAALESAEDGATLVTMHTTMNVTGRPAQFGRGVMVEVGGKLVDQFAGNLAELLATDNSAAAPATASTTPTDTSAPDASGTDASAVEDAGNADASAVEDASGADAGSASTGEASPVATSVPAASSAPTSSTPASSAPPAHEDSINLVKLVGPAILKRVVPAAAIAAGVALLARRLTRRFRRSAKD
jgi:uncharacterized protein